MDKDFDFELFIKVWQAAKSPAEVAAKMSITTQKAIGYASYLRTNGVDVKRLRRPAAEFERLKSVLESQRG